MKRNKFLIFVLLTVLIVTYPFLRFQTEKDTEMIRDFQNSTKKCLVQNVEYELTYFSYILPVVQNNSDTIFSYSIKDSWENANFLPLHLRFIATFAQFNLVGLHYLVFDSWHLVDILYVPYEEMCSFTFRNWSKGEKVNFSERKRSRRGQ